MIDVMVNGAPMEAVAQKGEQMGFVLYVAGSNAVVRYIPAARFI